MESRKCQWHKRGKLCSETGKCAESYRRHGRASSFDQQPSIEHLTSNRVCVPAVVFAGIDQCIRGPLVSCVCRKGFRRLYFIMTKSRLVTTLVDPLLAIRLCFYTCMTMINTCCSGELAPVMSSVPSLLPTGICHCSFSSLFGGHDGNNHCRTAQEAVRLRTTSAGDNMCDVSG